MEMNLLNKKEKHDLSVWDIGENHTNIVSILVAMYFAVFCSEWSNM